MHAYRAGEMAQWSTSVVAQKIFLKFLFSVYKCFASMYACVPCVYSTCGGQKRAIDP